MDTKYHIKDGCVYFNPEFNEPLNHHIDILKNCTQIIFSNYDDYVICDKTNNEHNSNYLYKYNKFNYPLDNCFNQLTQLKKLTFGHHFNHPLGNSLNQLVQLKELTFGHCFNQPLTSSLDNLVQLE